MDKIKLKNTIEALLMASDRILSVNQLEKLLTEQAPVSPSDEKQDRTAANDEKPAAVVSEKTEQQEVSTEETKVEETQSEETESEESSSLKRQIREVLENLQQDYAGRAMELKEVASGFRFQVKQDYAEYVGRLWEEKPAKYSRALLETLVLIAYRQPITRGEIEAIRGVSVSSHIIKTLVERDWVRVVGHRDVPGKPSIYGTTREFLDYFNLKSLDDLPSLADIQDLDKLAPELALDDASGGQQAESQAADASTDLGQRQIEIRRVRRRRRMQRQFGQSADTDNSDNSESTTSLENESDELEIS